MNKGPDPIPIPQPSPDIQPILTPAQMMEIIQFISSHFQVSKVWTTVKGLWATAMTAGLLFLMLHGAVGPLPGPEPVPPTPTEVISLAPQAKGDIGRMVQLNAVTQDPNAVVQWWCSSVADLAILKDTHNSVFCAPVAGNYSVLAWTVGKDGKPTQAVECRVTIGTPTPPVPPGPVPPTPGPTPTPIGEGLHVLILYKADDLAKYKQGQLDAMFGQGVRSYLVANCAKGADGKTPEFRVYPDNTDVSNESKTWQDAFKLSHDSLPWIIATNGANKGISQALPDSPQATLDLLKTIGGK